MTPTGSATLAQMEYALARVIGERGVAAMLARGRLLCSDEATEQAALRRLSSDLLGAALANRVLQPAGAARA